ncbi:HupE/UreJ family protein [Oricola indica]|jgi:hypothetical protein|uniref:HupE/UreJ family protein n=1 Tax=Oricola indica TaxID=2872591 RepID=UPI001CBAFC1A|nr:HupE/UreJ family protein [Oricola indica]
MRVIIQALFLLIWFAGAAEAHFSEGVKLRSIVVTRDGDGVTVFVRTPAPLLFGDLIDAAQRTGAPPDTGFIYSRERATGPVFHLSRDAIDADPEGFAARLENALAWSQNGQPLSARLAGFVLYDFLQETAFDSAQTARAAIDAGGATTDPLFGEAVIDMQLRLNAPVPDGALQVVSAHPPMPLVEGISVDNHIVDARGAEAIAYTRPGQLEEPATIDGSLARTVAEFVKQGVLHIVEGIDHVFLVVCLALGIGARTRLVWIVTAFTLGHSVTLIATFLGATPQWPWFIPAVETAIAATVLYAAAAAYFRRMDSVAVIAGVGLLHGLGFSFVLGDILGRDAPNLIPALAAFNVGIEIGQLAIIAVTLAMVAILTRLSRAATPVLRDAALAGIAAMSAWWVIERGAGLIA